MSKKSKSKATFNNRKAQGAGWLPWHRFERMLREVGYLTDQQQLKTVEMVEGGLEYTTNFKKNLGE